MAALESGISSVTRTRNHQARVCHQHEEATRPTAMAIADENFLSQTSPEPLISPSTHSICCCLEISSHCLCRRRVRYQAADYE